jgi:hypothetical protein
VYQHQEPVLIIAEEALRFPMAMELHKRYGVESCASCANDGISTSGQFGFRRPEARPTKNQEDAAAEPMTQPRGSVCKLQRQGNPHFWEIRTK